MSEWIADSSNVVRQILSQVEKRKNDLPILVLKVEKLYKVKLLEKPKNIEGTEGYVVKVMNEANGMEYLLFLQKVLASKFKEIGAKEGDVLAVVNKGKDMQTSYDYAVARWDESFNMYLEAKKEIGERLKELGDKSLRGIGGWMGGLRDERFREIVDRMKELDERFSSKKKKP